MNPTTALNCPTFGKILAARLRPRAPNYGVAAASAVRGNRFDVVTAHSSPASHRSAGNGGAAISPVRRGVDPGAFPGERAEPPRRRRECPRRNSNGRKACCADIWHQLGQAGWIPANSNARGASGFFMNHFQMLPLRRFSALRSVIPTSIPITSSACQLVFGLKASTKP